MHGCEVRMQVTFAHVIGNQVLPNSHAILPRSLNVPQVLDGAFGFVCHAYDDRTVHFTSSWLVGGTRPDRECGRCCLVHEFKRLCYFCICTTRISSIACASPKLVFRLCSCVSYQGTKIEKARNHIVQNSGHHLVIAPSWTREPTFLALESWTQL